METFLFCKVAEVEILLKVKNLILEVICEGGIDTSVHFESGYFCFCDNRSSCGYGKGRITGEGTFAHLMFCVSPVRAFLHFCHGHNRRSHCGFWHTLPTRSVLSTLEPKR